MEAGRPFNIRPTGPSDIRRIEGGILNHGVDMTLDTNPYEVGLERLVDLDKEAEFLGREALRRVRAEGVKRRLVGVEIEGAPIEFNMTRWPVRKDGETVGQVTSAIYSPRLKKNIGYAMVPVAHTASGTELKWRRRRVRRAQWWCRCRLWIRGRRFRSRRDGPQLAAVPVTCHSWLGAGILPGGAEPAPVILISIDTCARII